MNTALLQHNGAVAHEGMRLMGLCGHPMIAGSLSSRQHGWLDNKNHRDFVAHRKWFNMADHNPSDAHPAGEN